jgi:hypothetical protein
VVVGVVVRVVVVDFGRVVVVDVVRVVVVVFECLEVVVDVVAGFLSATTSAEVVILVACCAARLNLLTAEGQIVVVDSMLKVEVVVVGSGVLKIQCKLARY